MQCFRRLQVAWNIQEWKKIKWGRFEGWWALHCENDYQGQSEGYFIYTISKMLNKLDVLKQQSSKFTEMTYGAYSFRK